MKLHWLPSRRPAGGPGAGGLQPDQRRYDARRRHRYRLGERSPSIWLPGSGAPRLELAPCTDEYLKLIEEQQEAVRNQPTSELLLRGWRAAFPPIFARATYSPRARLQPARLPQGRRRSGRRPPPGPVRRPRGRPQTGELVTVPPTLEQSIPTASARITPSSGRAGLPGGDPGAVQGGWAASRATGWRCCTAPFSQVLDPQAVARPSLGTAATARPSRLSSRPARHGAALGRSPPWPTTSTGWSAPGAKRRSTSPA